MFSLVWSFGQSIAHGVHIFSLDCKKTEDTFKDFMMGRTATITSVKEGTNDGETMFNLTFEKPLREFENSKVFDIKDDRKATKVPSRMIRKLSNDGPDIKLNDKVSVFSVEWYLADESKKEIRSFFEEKFKVDAEAAEKTPGAVAIEKRNFRVVKLFLPPFDEKFGLSTELLGAEVADFSKMVIEAIKSDQLGKATMLKDLLAIKDVDINVKDETDEQTACIIAAKNKDYESLKVLLEKGADRKAADALGKTALYYAVAAGDSEAVKLLRDVKVLREAPPVSVEGEDPLAVNNQEITQKKTAVFEATENSNRSMLEVLVELNADLDISNNEGETPLMYAAKTKDIETLQKLLIGDAHLHRMLRRAVVP